MQCMLPPWASSFTPPQHSGGEEGLAHPSAARSLLAEVSAAPLAFSGIGWEPIWIKKSISAFLHPPVDGWTRFLRLPKCMSAHGSTKADVENAWLS